MKEFKRSLIVGGLIGSAWLFPGFWVGAVLALISVVTLCFAYHYLPKARYHFLIGAAAIGLAFYWLVQTIRDFGGYSSVPAVLVYLLFVAFSALQFVIAFGLYRRLNFGRRLESLRIPVAWVVVAIFLPRIFPWHFAHSMSGFLPLAQISDIAGAPLLSFLLLWFGSALTLRVTSQKSVGSIALALSCFTLLASYFYGQVRIQHFLELQTPQVRTAIVQANISINDKHNVKFFEKNTAEYVKLSETALEDESDILVIWPESVFVDWVAVNTPHVRNDPRLPYFGPKASLLMGALSFESRDEIYNSVFGIAKDGTISQPYHKQILMPFGEYMPFSDLFPWIKDFNPTAGDFSAGTSIKLIPFTQNEHEFKVAPLICYEDVVPSMAKNAVLAGADLLVNQTNDAWFGQTLAPFQHHQIAVFRAIETRRSLIRSTNTGLTAVVQPTGRTSSQLPTFSDGVLKTAVSLQSEETLYVRGAGLIFEWSLVVISMIGLLAHLRLKSASNQ